MTFMFQLFLVRHLSIKSTQKNWTNHNCSIKAHVVQKAEKYTFMRGPVAPLLDDIFRGGEDAFKSIKSLLYLELYL